METTRDRRDHRGLKIKSGRRLETFRVKGDSMDHGGLEIQ